VGLFVHTPGKRLNLPVVLSGAIAALPSEKLATFLGPAQVHMLHMGVQGGFSGSPVFVRAHVEGGGLFYLIGLAQAFWSDVQVAEPRPGTRVIVKSNLGLLMVTPVDRILDVLNLPELAMERDRMADGIDLLPESPA